MKPPQNRETDRTWHPISKEDKAAMTAMRAIVEPNKGRLQGTAARGPFDSIMSRVVAPVGVTFAPDTVGGVSGWWCRPESARTGQAILHLHGGWFNWGSAQAFINLVGHIAARAGVEAFVPDYRLAPEHLFPAATEDVLIERGFSKVAITGDSAGGNLALGLLHFAAAQRASSGVLPVAAVALSPITDLALTGASWETRASPDPYFLRSQAAELVRSYLGGHDPADPLASPLYGKLAGLPPIRVHVGDDEVLLDDSLRYVERAVEAAGHTVVVSNSRGPETLADFVADLGPGAIAGTKQQAAACDVVILAINWVKVPEALKGIDWRGRILIDATNAHMDPKPDISLAGVTRSRAALKGRTSSEMVAEMAVGARLVKSIRNMPMAWIQDFSPSKPRTVIFTSGDDNEAKQLVIELVNSTGLVAIDLGSLAIGGSMHEVGAPLSGLDLHFVRRLR